MNKLLIIGSLLIQCTVICGYEEAIAIVPVADLVGQPLQETFDQPVYSYNTLPICGKHGNFACPRIHQLLFHEIINIVEYRDNEVCVQLPNIFFQTDQSLHKKAIFWTHKDNIVLLSSLFKKGVNRQQLPEPINYNATNSYNNQQSIIALMEPHYDATTGLTFSAGTRFVEIPDSSHKQVYSVYVLNPKKLMVQSTTLPKKICVHAQLLHTPQQQKMMFVDILRAWAQQKQFIAYVWGGCSYLEKYTDNNFYDLEKNLSCGQTISFYARNQNHSIYTGFDCAGMIARAAQLCNIPYFFKNTTTLARNLKPLDRNQHCVDGDLIWIPGHVMAISDRRNNLIVEARHYSHGYGKVHEISLNKTFKNIETFDQLEQAFFTNQPLARLDAHGNTESTIKNFKLLQLSSIWNCQ